MIFVSDVGAVIFASTFTIYWFSTKTSPSKIVPSFTILAFLIRILSITIFYNLLKNFLILNKITPNTASLIIDPLILDCPLVLSVKMIGTSTILNPLEYALYFISI